MNVFSGKRIILLAYCILPPLAFAGAPFSTEPTIALISKVILDVTRKEAGKDWLKAARGEVLGSGDMVKTGENSFAIIKFKDNSLVRVRERSQLTVTGDQKGTAFSKAVDISNGAVGFNVKKQAAGEEFRFSSPTSVASIRGTGGLFAVSDSADTLTILEGTVTLLNRITGTTLDVSAGWTGVSGRNGTLTSHHSTSEEKNAAADAVRTGDQQRRLELELRDGQGREKRLHIDFKD